MVGKPSEQDEKRRAEQKPERDQDLRRHRRHFQGLGEKEQRVELSAVPDHRLTRGGAEQSQDRDLGVRPLPEGLRQRPFRVAALLLHAQEDRRLGQLQPDPDRDREQDRREQERNSPAVGHRAVAGEGRLAHAGADAQHHQQRHEQADGRGGLNPRRIEAALVLGRVLGDVDRGAAVLPAERETLEQAQPDQRDRRRDAPGRVARQEADGERAQPHQGHGDEERIFAADEIAEPPEEQRAERTHRKPGREGEQGEDEGGRGVDPGEELHRQDGSERSVDVEVVPFENGAERRGEDDQPLVGGHGSSLPLH